MSPRERRLALAGVALAAVVLAGIIVVADRMGDDPARRARLDPQNRAVLIEGGFFWTGNADPDTISSGPYITHDETRAPKTVRPFWIQEHEVTNEEYRRFDPGHEFPEGREDHPVVSVTWRQAWEYADSLGGRLPTETEWEFAARGTGSREYPWGDEVPTCRHAQFRDCEPRATVPVMSRPDGATPEGVHDLAGNVWEWVVADWFLLASFPANRESSGSRGGSFRSEPFFLRASNRNRGFLPGFRTDDLGFRVVWPVDHP